VPYGTGSCWPKRRAPCGSRATTTSHPQSLNREYLIASGSKSLCPWKGLASYYTVTAGDEVNPDAAWYYPHPSPLARRIKNHVAFWRGVRVEGHPEPRAMGGSGQWWRKLVGRGA
jgi:hypothetical protein